MENNEEQTVFESKLVKNFITNLRNGTSFLQEPNSEPAYVQNYATGIPYTGINMLIINQGMKDKGKTAMLAMSNIQAENLKLYIEKGKEKIGTAIYEDSNAFYKKNDPEVISGKHKASEHKVDENGKPVNDTIYSFVFAAEDIVKTKFEVKRDNEGNAIKYAENVYAKNKNGEIIRYNKDGIINNKFTNETIAYKAGDPVIKHLKGSVQGELIGTKEHIVQPEKNHLPPFITEKNIAKLPEINEKSTAKEILIAKLAEAFRGKLQGNYSGLKISLEQIDKIEKEYLTHPRAFRGAVKSAQTRAMGNIETIKRMDEAIQKRKNESINEYSNEDVKKQTKKTGKSR